MFLSRVGSVLLVLLSLFSFGLVYVLNVDEKGGETSPMRQIVDQFLQAGLMPSIAPVADVLPPPSTVVIEKQAAAFNPAVFRREEVKDGVTRRILVVGRGETITSRLVAAGISKTEIMATLERLRQHVNPRRIRGGQEVAVLFRQEDNGERYVGLELRDGKLFVSIARREGDVFRAETKEIVPQKTRFAVRGVVNDSLYEAGLKAGVPTDVLQAMTKTYSYNIDFQRDIHDGDVFEVLYEQNADENGRGVGDATLIYSALQTKGKIMPIYRVAMPGGGFEFYDAKGSSIRKGLLRTPVESAKLTSGFGMRRHPIMGFSRMHKGVDFAAPTGSPIYAAGAGIVEDAGRKSGYGNYIRIRHHGKLSTAYAHMSGFGRGIARGTRVNQGDIIGYVGSTGASTGPHLHYEILVENEQVNPLSVDIPTNSALEGRQLTAFQEWRGKIHSQFEQIIASGSAGRVAQNTR